MTLTSNMGTDVKPQNVVGLFPWGRSVQQRQMIIPENQKALVLLPPASGTNLMFLCFRFFMISEKEPQNPSVLIINLEYHRSVYRA